MPTSRGALERRRQRRPGRLRDRRATRARRTSSARPPARSTSRGAIRVCDLFDRPLAISFWFTRGARLRCRPRTRSTTSPALPRPGQLPLDQRPRRPRRASSASSASAAGRCRSAGIATAPSRNLYRVGVCPTVALAYPGGILERGRDRRATSSTASGCRRSVGGEALGRRVERRAAGPMSEARPEARLGGPGAARGVPGLGASLPRGRARLGAQPGEVKQRLRELSDRFVGRAGDQHAPSADPLGLPRLLPPHRPRPRRAADAGRGAGARADAARAAFAARTCSTTRSRSRSSSRGSRCARSTPTRSTGRLGSGRARRGEGLEGRPGELPAGHPGDRRRARGPSALLFGATADGRGVPPARSGRCSVRSAVSGRARDRGRRGDLARGRGPAGVETPGWSSGGVSASCTTRDSAGERRRCPSFATRSAPGYARPAPLEPAVGAGPVDRAAGPR